MQPEQPIQLTPLTKPIRLRFTGAHVQLPQELSSKIEARWKELAQNNPHLFNGEGFTVTSFTETPEAIEVELAETNFAHNMYSEAFDIGEYAFRVIHSACLVITSDNKLVVGEMGKNTARAGVICCSGGGLDRGDIRGDTIDLDYSTSHELREELGIDPQAEHVISFKPAYLKTGGPRNKMTVLYELHTTLSSKTFAQNYERFTTDLARKNEAIEYDRLFYIENTPAAVEAFIAEHKAHLDAYIPALFRAVSQQK